MALMNWAIDVPQKLLQSDAKPFPPSVYLYLFIDLFDIDRSFLMRKDDRRDMGIIFI
jgi:hypothetical protein